MGPGQCLEELYVHLPFDPAISLLQSDSPKVQWPNHGNIYALFVIAKIWKWPKCPQQETGWIHYGTFKQCSPANEWERSLGYS